MYYDGIDLEEAEGSAVPHLRAIGVHRKIPRLRFPGPEPAEVEAGPGYVAAAASAAMGRILGAPSRFTLRETKNLFSTLRVGGDRVTEETLCEIAWHTGLVSGWDIPLGTTFAADGCAFLALGTAAERTLRSELCRYLPPGKYAVAMGLGGPSAKLSDLDRIFVYGSAAPEPSTRAMASAQVLGYGIGASLTWVVTVGSGRTAAEPGRRAPWP